MTEDNEVMGGLEIQGANDFRASMDFLPHASSVGIQGFCMHPCPPSMSDVPPPSSSPRFHILECYGRITESYLVTQLCVPVRNMESAAGIS